TGSTVGPTSDRSELLSEVRDTTSNAKPGGIWTVADSRDALSMDPYGVSVGSAHASYAYSRLVRYTPAPYPTIPTGAVEGDGAESWEVSPDGLTFSFKLRDNLVLD